MQIKLFMRHLVIGLPFVMVSFVVMGNEVKTDAPGTTEYILIRDGDIQTSDVGVVLGRPAKVELNLTTGTNKCGSIQDGMGGYQDSTTFGSTATYHGAYIRFSKPDRTYRGRVPPNVYVKNRKFEGADRLSGIAIYPEGSDDGECIEVVDSVTFTFKKYQVTCDTCAKGGIYEKSDAAAGEVRAAGAGIPPGSNAVVALVGGPGDNNGQANTNYEIISKHADGHATGALASLEKGYVARSGTTLNGLESGVSPNVVGGVTYTPNSASQLLAITGVTCSFLTDPYDHLKLVMSTSATLTDNLGRSDTDADCSNIAISGPGPCGEEGSSATCENQVSPPGCVGASTFADKLGTNFCECVCTSSSDCSYTCGVVKFVAGKRISQ